MDMTQLVPLYLTIIMVILVALALLGPGDKGSSDKK